MKDDSAHIAISVVLPVYNGGDYVKQSVQSVLEQDLKNFEFLILDDCSTDGSYEYLQGLHDDRIKLFRNETNRGLFYNLNFLLAQSQSPLIKLWAQDDIMFPHCLSSFVKFHQKHSQIGFSYSGRTMIDEKGSIIKNDRIDDTPEIISTELHARIAYFTGSIAGNIANVCINKAALNRVGLFKESMKISADFDMWVRLAEHYETGFIRDNLIQLRDHTGQLSRNEKFYIEHVKEDMEVYKYLDSYVSPKLKVEGKKIMRNQKLFFYYTLMLKSCLHFNLKISIKYFQLITSYDKNFLGLSLDYIKSKIGKLKKPAFPETDILY